MGGNSLPRCRVPKSNHLFSQCNNVEYILFGSFEYLLLLCVACECVCSHECCASGAGALREQIRDSPYAALPAYTTLTPTATALQKPKGTSGISPGSK